MSFMDLFRRRGSRKDSQARQVIALSQLGPYVPRPKNYAEFADEGYSKNIIAYRSITLVSRGAAPVQWVLYKKAKGKNGKRQEIETHPILDLLKNPNPMMAQSIFMESITSYKLISGNSYIEASGPTQGSLAKITELWPLRPDRMTVVPGARGYPAGYIYKLGSIETRYNVDFVSLKSPVLHMKFFHPTNDWYGLSPVEAAALGIDMHNSANEWNVSLMRNSARPSGALVATVNANSTGFFTEEQFMRLKNEVEEKYTGSSNAGRPMLLEGGLNWQSFSFTPQQMEWIENKNTSARDVCQAFGVPPQMLGIPGDNTYANYQEARAALYEDTILPLHDSIRDDLNSWLVPGFNGGDGLYLDSDKDSIHALAPRRQAVWDKVSGANFLTVNEKREATGYEPVEGGDVILVANTQATLEDVLEGPDPADPEDPNDDENAPDPTDDDGDTDPDGEDTPPAKKPPKKGSVSQREEKVFNLTEKEKRTEINGQLRARAGLQNKLTRQAQAVFAIEGHRVLEAVKGLDSSHAEYAASREISDNQRQWKTILTANLTQTAKLFSSRVFRSLKSQGLSPETKESQSAYDEFIQNWIQDHVGERVKGIAETSRERVISAIQEAQQEAYDQGEGVETFADLMDQKLRDTYDGFSESRAITIARTETGTAANLALHEAAKSTGIAGRRDRELPLRHGFFEARPGG